MAPPYRVWLLAFAAIGLGQPVQGLGLLADGRFTSFSITFPGCCDSVDKPDSFFGPFANSSFTIAPDGLGLDGSALGRASSSTNPDGSYWSYEYVFSIGFRIDGAGSFDVDGCFDSHDASNGFASVALFAGDQPIFSQKQTIAYCSLDQIAFTSDLAPGPYAFEAYATCSGVDCGTSFQLTFQVRDTAVPIPEASTLLSVGAGLAWMARLRVAHSRASRSPP